MLCTVCFLLETSILPSYRHFYNSLHITHMHTHTLHTHTHTLRTCTLTHYTHTHSHITHTHTHTPSVSLHRCGGLFCAIHRYAESHSCTFDYKAEGRQMIARNNPVVTAPKLPKIWWSCTTVYFVFCVVLLVLKRHGDLVLQTTPFAELSMKTLALIASFLLGFCLTAL